MRRLDFKEASELIKAVDAELKALLSDVWDQATKVCQRDLCFFLARYPYKHFVFKDGKALDPDGNRSAPTSSLLINCRSDSSSTIRSRLLMRSSETKK